MLHQDPDMHVDETVLHLVVKNTLSLWIVNFPPKYFEVKIKVFEQIVQWLEKGVGQSADASRYS